MKLRRWTIVLVSPQESGNVGGAARVLKNFGGAGLRVVAPRCEVNGNDSRRFSSGAGELLRGAEHFDTLEDAIADRELTVALTGVPGRYHRLDYSGLVPGNLLEGRESFKKCALVFGREERGLLGEELELCDLLWSLPTDPDFPSLNLVQAIGIALAGVAEAERNLSGREVGLGLAPSTLALTPIAGSPAPEDQPATNEQLNHLARHGHDLLERTGWGDGRRTSNSLSRLRNLFVRGKITNREANLLHGICKNCIHTLDTEK